VRLIRSKGVGVYFVTQNPRDVPDNVLGQLGNRVQHALRAFTPRDQKSIKAAAETFRKNPALDTEAVLTQLGVGEALVSLLDEKGAPTVVERAFILPPGSQIGPITAQQRQGLVQRSPVFGHYEKVVDRESAYEILTERAKKAAAEQATAAEQKAAEKKKPGFFEKLANTFTATATRTVATSIGREITRGILGGILGGSKRRKR
jgi:DNA helicase HerA-like ATPase